MKSLRDQIADRCVHFNGLQNDQCRAGLRYRDIRAQPAGRIGLPCFRDESGPRCELRCFPSEEQIAARLAEVDDALKQYHDAIEAGRCPTCAAPSEPLRQDGRCVYAACGHRLGQGRVAAFRGARPVSA